MSKFTLEVNKKTAILGLPGTYLSLRLCVYKNSDEKIWEVSLGEIGRNVLDIQKRIFIKTPKVVDLHPELSVTIADSEIIPENISGRTRHHVIIPLTGGALLVDYGIEKKEVDLTGVYITERELTRVAL